MNVKIKRLHPAAVIPQYAKPGDSGFDLVAVEDVIIAPGETVLVPTGLAFEIPEGCELQVRPRSGISLRTKLRVANSPGTVDAGFRGEVAVIVDNISKPHRKFFLRHPQHWNISAKREGTCIIRAGDRIAQAVITPVVHATFEVADELTETERGAGGFGSTGVSVTDAAVEEKEKPSG
ncbi:dUTP diphosphatase [Paenibacillus chibensis]|uniref:dUTP diphosphatase n=1 Tax=Paenibacillus chibensis TaxID=59846 RepID=UPI000FDB0E67|nr:dUTP diphosphatase [Paenibacillus chibensis]MEC0370017.1 dUTP diphosphatase [Paenibacillus chibensis]